MGAYDKKIPGHLFDRGGYISNVKHPDFAGGAQGDGVTEDTAAFLALDAALATPNPGVPAGEYPVGAMALNKVWAFQRGAVALLSAGEPVSMPVPQAGDYQIFQMEEGAVLTFSTPGVVRPEWFGHDVDNGGDGNAAWRSMIASLVDGCTVWLENGKTYIVGAGTMMDSPDATLVIAGKAGLALDGGGTLKLADTAGAVGTLLRIEDSTDIYINIRVDGNKDGIPSANDVDVLMLSGCERIHLGPYVSTDSAQHGINFTNCRYVTSGPMQSFWSRKYGMSLQTPFGANLGQTTAVGSEERHGHELTDGPDTVLAGHILAVGCVAGVNLGQHGDPGQSSRAIVYPPLLVNGIAEDQLALVPPGTEPTLAQIVTEDGVEITGGTDGVNPNNHYDTTFVSVNVHYATTTGLKAQQAYRLQVGQTNLINAPGEAPSSRGIYTTLCGQAQFGPGRVRGFGRMAEVLDTDLAVFRGIIFESNSARLVVDDSKRVVLDGCIWSANTPSDFLIEISGSNLFEMESIDIVNCLAFTDNTKLSVRLDMGYPASSPATVKRFRMVNNIGLTADIYRGPGTTNYEPVLAYHATTNPHGGYYTDDTVWRTFPVNNTAGATVTPRVDRSRNWVVKNTATTNLAGFTGGREGMEINVHWDEALTTAVYSGAAHRIIGGVTRAPASGKYSRYVYQSGIWIEMVYR